MTRMSMVPAESHCFPILLASVIAIVTATGLHAQESPAPDYPELKLVGFPRDLSASDHAQVAFAELLQAQEELDDVLSKVEDDAPIEDPVPNGDETQSSQIDVVVSGRQVQFSGGRFQLPSLKAVTISTANVGNGRVPEGFREGGDERVVALPESGVDRGGWAHTTRFWAAPNTFSHPRYFEDRMLERHGHERFPHLTPVLSGVHFFATVPALPYLMTVSRPCSCESTLGYLRPGSCVPAYRQRPPIKREAILAEASAIAAGILIFP